MDLINLNKKKFTLSFEIFPPKTIKGEEKLWSTLDRLALYQPNFISVTYGAGGSTRDKTLELALKIKQDYNLLPLVHFTCVGASKEEIKKYLQEAKQHGLNNILALRGDPPQGEKKFTPGPNGFSYANELVSFIKKVDSFKIGVAGYPEGHPESSSLDQDLDNLKKKVEAGASFIITQLFYDNNFFYEFVNKARQKGVKVPILPGVMPLTNLNQIDKIPSMFGASIPLKLKELARKYTDPKSLQKAGIDFSIEQCQNLQTWGVAGFHLYTLNRADSVEQIIKALKF